MRNIGQIRSSITDDVGKTLVHTLVTSRLHYGNGLLHCLLQTKLQGLQRVQNSAVILPYEKSRAHYSLLQGLLWLPIRLGPTYKVLLFSTFRDEWSGTGLSRGVIRIAIEVRHLIFIIGTSFADSHAWRSSICCGRCQSVESVARFSDTAAV